MSGDISGYGFSGNSSTGYRLTELLAVLFTGNDLLVGVPSIHTLTSIHKIIYPSLNNLKQ